MKITQRMCSLLLIALFLGLVSLTALAQRPGGGRRAEGRFRLEHRG